MDMVNTPDNIGIVSIAEDMLGRRGRPQEVAVFQRTPDINKRGGKGNIEHKVG